MAQPKKAAPDWERIEGDYRAGLLSVREIAASQGISHTAIQKRAKAEGWVRDLSKRIQDKAEALVAKREVAKSVAMETSVSDLAIIDANAEVIAGIRLAHRKDIARSRNLAMALLAELEAVTGSTELFEHLGEMLRAQDDKGQDKRNDLYQKAISMSGRVSNMKALSDTLKTLVGLEREAYGINAAAEGGGNEAPVGLDHFYGDVEEGDA